MREGAKTAYDRVDEIPEVLRVRPISLRAFDADDLMVDAELVDGGNVESVRSAPGRRLGVLAVSLAGRLGEHLRQYFWTDDRAHKSLRQSKQVLVAGDEVICLAARGEVQKWQVHRVSTDRHRW